MSRSYLHRHIGTNDADQTAMAEAIGVGADRRRALERVMDAAVPAVIRPGGAFAPGALPETGASEAEALAELRALAARNRVLSPMIGLGYSDTITPPVIQRGVLENPSWYTAYTPYQPEISQGRLEALLNFQTMVGDLTGLPVANASMLDEATAAVEGMLVARRASKSTSNVFLVDADALPQTKAVLAVRAEALGIVLHETPYDPSAPAAPDAFGALIQYPGASGRIWDPRDAIAAVQARGGLAVVAADLVALTLIASPGSLGADIVVGSTQRFGVPLGFGGPHAGCLAVRAGLERQLPGRLVGVSVDAEGALAYRLALQTREQHIRREKATSNICTAQVLLAVMASMYAVYHGPEGLFRIASEINAKANSLWARIEATGAQVVHRSFFDTLTVRVPGAAGDVIAEAHERGVQLHLVDADTVSLSVGEATTRDDLASVAAAFHAVATATRPAFVGEFRSIPEALQRQDAFLTHPVFHAHRSETAMMRYLRALADKDYALDRGMIPLGSCTMKLNAAAAMTAISWPEFGRIHPLAPSEDVAGYLALIAELETWLAELTGYDAVSLQPNAGSQGELAGLLAIREWHRSRGELRRDVCLIPSSAHGTNAASAVLAGMRVVVVATAEGGDVDLEDLRAKITEHADSLAALMITYPSTHGVYEADVKDITAAVHSAGGQVYIDGANLNALVGHSRFGDLGGDVSHLNLHKTFAIPHGGGGPGVGPVAAKAHLAPFLPTAERPVSAAPHGSAGILPITWAYIRMMGRAGLTDATSAAVLAANYVAARLRDHYPVLYTGERGLVAHECILDLRPLREETGITVDDVAKRLIDYGFHAPTMSFPVPGTLMVEPTESEDLGELDRFVEAMIAIHDEARRVGAGEWPADDNPLVNAPHTAACAVATQWPHPYSRELAVYPAGNSAGKYWPPVRRVDQAYGDRHLVCACPPIEAFADAGSVAG
ncbi:aminomethyl-transferring glycine dehydrogenase [Microbacterium stercoris]|uniref:Glycine dehydrogenase (decarboxylating) n=1 Tax=Microbacterium stercoris TaxID=2820289 RepID=A0A939TLM9_9MICO|nr:aminomethyl-transferring glycine dehydrogenase [Microbacterium stercoris]MBO3662293.1 aminomethyl-transferring glycine dehydrogenase [Microbacterium stercoris]